MWEPTRLPTPAVGTHCSTMACTHRFPTESPSTVVRTCPAVPATSRTGRPCEFRTAEPVLSAEIRFLPASGGSFRRPETRAVHQPNGQPLASSRSGSRARLVQRRPLLGGREGVGNQPAGTSTRRHCSSSPGVRLGGTADTSRCRPPGRSRLLRLRRPCSCVLLADISRIMIVRHGVWKRKRNATLRFRLEVRHEVPGCDSRVPPGDTRSEPWRRAGGAGCHATANPKPFP